MKKQLLLMLLLPTLGLAPIAALAKTAMPTKQPLMFVQTAENAKIAALPGTHGEYSLTLHGKSPQVTFLTERPHRIAGTISKKQFASFWQKGRNPFSKSAPNADIYTKLSANKEVNIPVELTALHYDQKSHNMVYHIRALKGATESLKKMGKYKLLGETVLYIDPWCLSCIGN